MPGTPTIIPALPSETIVVGKPIDRLDGKLKVTGAARYAGDVFMPNMAHAVAIVSTIANGRIVSIDSTDAEKLPGVLAIITHQNAGKLLPGAAHGGGQVGQPTLLQSPDIDYAGQYIALAVANTLEQAQQAASLVHITYDAKAPQVDPEHPINIAEHGRNERGDARATLANAPIKIEQTYETSILTHNPMEMHATVAAWDGGKLTLYDATQNVGGTRNVVATVLGVPRDQTRVIDPFVGGAFGCKGSVWPNSYLAALAARHVNRPVKLIVSRQQMFSQVGHRPRTTQKMTLGADRNGKLLAIAHETTSETAIIRDWVENTGGVTTVLYNCPDVLTTQKVARFNVSVPTQMRAPGEATGNYALESAMNELADELKIDPIELRLRNYAEIDPSNLKPFTSKSLRECYQIGSEKFGWSRRTHAPRSMRDGDELIGMGMASCTYPAYQAGASASCRLMPDGSISVTSAAHDLGTGTYTILAQIAAETLGVSPEHVRVEIGDTALPRAPGAGGSTQAVSVGSAVLGAAVELLKTLRKMASHDANSPLAGKHIDSIVAVGGRLQLADDATVSESLATIAKRAGRPITAMADAAVNPSINNKFSRYSFGAQFIEVRVNPQLGRVRVSRALGVFAAGRILNAKTARSQLMGGIVMGLGMSLWEQTRHDYMSGKIVTDNLADYLVPVNADIPAIEVIFFDEKDEHINPLGAKGVGELGITGVPAAVMHAVYHATGKRVRDLPITADKVIDLT